MPLTTLASVARHRSSPLTGPQSGPHFGPVAGLFAVLVLGSASMVMSGPVHADDDVDGAEPAVVVVSPEAAAVPLQADGWSATVARVADSVVSLKLSQLRDFDDSRQGGSTATGFVVDAERGIVLTNRHVVGSGPIRLSATFQNQERVDAVPLYRDPIHDYAFIRFDPDALRFARPESLSLRPDKVRTGMDIRVIGSDGGEQLSILPGTIARLDREVPSYGRYGYNDFNTFYLQAASGTSGGSSGSPVIDLDGDVVALNAAANSRTASSFFLPLPRIVSALEKLRAGESIPRGGLQTIFSHQPFRELSRLGLDTATEQRVREQPGTSSGMLIVQQVIPGGVADQILQAGDILVSINDTLITEFISLEALLDEHIGQTLPIEVIRQGQAKTLEASVADLHAIAPGRFIELGDAVLQDMSIQHARAMNMAQSGVVVMRPGYFFTRAGVAPGSVINAVDGAPMTGLDDFLDAVRNSPEGERMLVTYVVPGREFSVEVAQLEIDDRWFGHRSCERVDDVRFWDCEQVELTRQPPVEDMRSALVPTYRDPLLNRVAPSMVQVDFHIPFSTDNVYARHFKGVGLIVDREQGLVAVDRNTVPIGMGEAEITFFGSQVVAGNVVFLHPRHNVALLKFDPEVLGDAEFEPLELASYQDHAPESLTMVGYRNDGTFRLHPVDDLSRVTIGFPSPRLPRFQQSALDVYSLPNVPPSLGGPLVDADGRVHAYFMSFAYESDREIQQAEFAMPSYVIAEALRLYRADQPWMSLDLRLNYQPLALARQRGLPDEWLARYLDLPADARRVLYVDQVVPGTDAAMQVAAGDVLLAIDGELVSNLFLTEQLSQAEQVTLSLLRRGSVIEVDVAPGAVDALGTHRIVSWAGAIFQEPHVDIGYAKGVDFPGVYIADTHDGSPALWDELYRNRFVAGVDGQPVESLDDFITLISDKQQDEVTRLTTISMSGRNSIVTVEPEYNFWPTFEIVREDGDWRRIDHDH